MGNASPSFMAMAIGGLMMLIGLGVVWVNLSEYMTRLELAENGIETNARVYEKFANQSRTKEGSGSTNYFLRFEYADSTGETFRLQKEVFKDLYFQYEEGDEDFPVVYLQGKPLETRPKAMAAAAELNIEFYLAGGIGFLGLAVFALGLIARLR